MTQVEVETVASSLICINQTLSTFMAFDYAVAILNADDRRDIGKMTVLIAEAVNFTSNN